MIDKSLPTSGEQLQFCTIRQASNDYCAVLKVTCTVTLIHT